MPAPRLIALSLCALAWAVSLPVGADPRISLQDDFSDGTLAPWQQLKAGTVALEPEGGGYLLRKQTNADPNGAGRRLRSQLATSSWWCRPARSTLDTTWAWLRYSLSNANGDGYGIGLTHGDGSSSNGAMAGYQTVQATRLAQSGGLTVGVWYTLRLVREGSVIHGRRLRRAD